jgi:hypothetical protein
LIAAFIFGGIVGYGIRASQPNEPVRRQDRAA